jgi:hypothetical protein
VFLHLKRMRHNLLKEGRVGKYFFYALGEIFLVVVGILIALQVNNLDIEMQAKSIERQYYQTMRDQLVEDQELLINEIYGTKKRIANYVGGLKMIVDGDREHLKELAGNVHLLIEYGDFRRKSSVYQTLIFSGEIKHIKNKSIIRYLQEIERAYQIIERLETTQANLVMTHTAPIINELLDFESGVLVFPELVFTHSVKNSFSLAKRLAEERYGLMEHAVSVIDGTLKKINAELDAAS